MSNALTATDLHYAYPDGQVALTGVSFTVSPGERLALLGPNGAGKTTLAHHLNGIRRGNRGWVEVGDLRLDDGTVAEIRRRVGLVFQNADDQLFMPTVGQDVAFGPANLGIAGEHLEKVVTEALAAVGAEELVRRVPHHLSGGERRKVALATVLAMEPSVLVLDEPTSGLDPAGRRELIEVLETLPMAQLVITHDLPFALELCDRTLIMDGGRIVADGETAEILGDEALLKMHRLEMP
ncbi:MAG TPA: ABC transporter ATP-binding protein [Acidimicrobiia bacterium]|nr:ABC transporter ATP-binding protein [Acidimicrobiia bacterium]